MLGEYQSYPVQHLYFMDAETEAQEVLWALEPDMANMFYAIECNLDKTIVISYTCNI